MSTVEQNVQVIQKLYEAFGRGDVAAVLACVDENATWINPYGQGRFPGQWGKPVAINEAVEVRGFNPYEIVAQGDKVVVLIKWNGIVRQTGAAFDVLLVHVWTMRAGKVVDYIGLDDATAYPF